MLPFGCGQGIPRWLSVLLQKADVEGQDEFDHGHEDTDEHEADRS